MYGPWKIDPSDKKKSAMKMICLGEDQKVGDIWHESIFLLSGKAHPLLRIGSKVCSKLECFKMYTGYEFVSRTLFRLDIDVCYMHCLR